MDYVGYFTFHLLIISAIILTGIAFIVVTSIFYHKAKKYIKLERQNVSNQERE